MPSYITGLEEIVAKAAAKIKAGIQPSTAELIALERLKKGPGSVTLNVPGITEDASVKLMREEAAKRKIADLEKLGAQEAAKPEMKKAAGLLAMPAASMDIGEQMNPLKPLGYAAQKYQDAKQAVLMKFAEQTDLTPGGAKDYRENAQAIGGAVLDPANLLPGAGAVVAPIAEQALASQNHSPNKFKKDDFTD